MANENPSPTDPSPTGAPASSIEVLLAGNIADDDMMWVVRCPADELTSLVLAPVEWVAALGALPGWLFHDTGERAPAPTLTLDFAMSVSLAETPDPQARIVVQGISGTNALSVALSPTGAAFGAFWDDLGRDPGNPPSMRKALPINVVAPISTLYGHFEILDRTETRERRAERTATFLLAAVLDPAGYSAMLGGLDQTVTTVGAAATGAEGEGASPSAIPFPPAAPRVLYANVENGGDADGEPDETNVCGSLTAPFPGGQPGPPTTTVKRWGEKTGEPPAGPPHP